MSLSVVIVNWNTRESLRACLRSVFRNEPPEDPVQVIVVDNASSDGSVQAVRAAFPNVQIIENTENVGFAAANNQGIQAAQGKFVLLLNPDTIVLDNSLNVLLETMLQNPQIGVLGPRLLNQDGSIQPSVMRFPSLFSTITGFMRRRIHGESKMVPRNERTDVSYVQCVTGACLMIRRAVFQDVGLLDESYFMYAEEVDFCYRVNQADWKVAHTPSARIVHLRGQSTKQVSERMYVERRKSRIRFLLRHRGRFQAVLAALLIEANIVFRYLAAIGKPGRSRFGQILSLYHQSVYPMLF